MQMCLAHIIAYNVYVGCLIEIFNIINAKWCIEHVEYL